MHLREVMELLGCEAAWGLELLDGVLIAACFAADLMSDVLAFAEPGALLLTGLVSIQSAHAADVSDLAGIVYVAGKRPAPPVIELARKKGIPLLVTPLSMFEACGCLHAAGIRAGVRS
jgi:hypothetical protein